MPGATTSILKFIELFAGDLIKFGLQKLGQADLFQKLKQLYFPDQHNDFQELYARTLIELWHRNENEHLIALFKEQNIIDAIYDEIYKNITYEQMTAHIESVYHALPVGTELTDAGLSAADAAAIFFTEFKRQIRENGSISDWVIYNNLNARFDELQRGKHKTLLQKFEKEPDKIKESEILKAICSDDPLLKAYGIICARDFRFKDASSLIIDELYSSDTNLVHLAIDATGVLKIREAAERMINMFDHPDPNRAADAKWTYFTYLKEINHNNFPQWLQWLHAKDDTLQINAIKTIAEYSGKGMIDIESILSDLKEVLNNSERDVREYIYRILLNYERPTGINWEERLRKEADEAINTLCVARFLFREGKDEVVGKAMLEKLNNTSDDPREFSKTFQLCRNSSNEACQKAWSRYKELPNIIIETISMEHLFEPVPVKPNAFTKEQAFREYTALSNEIGLVAFLDTSSHKSSFNIGNRKCADTIIIDTEASILTIDGIMHFLKQRHSYTPVDLRNKTELETRSLLANCRNTKKICLIIPKELPMYIENTMRTIYDDKAIILYDKQNNTEKIPVGDETDLLMLVSLDDYNVLHANYSFSRFVGLSMLLPHKLVEENDSLDNQ